MAWSPSSSSLEPSFASKHPEDSASAFCAFASSQILAWRGHLVRPHLSHRQEHDQPGAHGANRRRRLLLLLLPPPPPPPPRRHRRRRRPPPPPLPSSPSPCLS